MRVLAAILGCFAAVGVASGQTTFYVELDGDQVPTASAFTGSGTVVLNVAETMITVNIVHNIPNVDVNDGHIHVGAVGVNGGIIFPFPGMGQNPISETLAISPAQVAILESEGYYVNIHTDDFPNGEIRGQIVQNRPISAIYFINMNGAQVPTGSSFTGGGVLTLNPSQTYFNISLTHNIPNGDVNDGHIHLGGVGVNGGIIFPFAGLGQSPIDETIEISPAQLTVLNAEGYYVNIHTDAFPSGEIRGQILLQPTGLPVSSWSVIAIAALLLTVLGAAAIYRLRHRSIT